MIFPVGTTIVSTKVIMCAHVDFGPDGLWLTLTRFSYPRPYLPSPQTARPGSRAIPLWRRQCLYSSSRGDEVAPPPAEPVDPESDGEAREDQHDARRLGDNGSG